MNKQKLIKNQKGATAVEFAIVLPLLLFILFGIIEFSLILYNKAMLTNACREGARATVLFSWPERINETEIDKVVRDYSERYLVLFKDAGYSPPEITVCEEQGDFITVRLEYDYTFLFLPFAKIPLNSQSVMRCE